MVAGAAAYKIYPGHKIIRRSLHHQIEQQVANNRRNPYMARETAPTPKCQRGDPREHAQEGPAGCASDNHQEAGGKSNPGCQRFLPPNANQERRANRPYCAGEDGNSERTLGAQPAIADRQLLSDPTQLCEQIPMKQLLAQHFERDGYQQDGDHFGNPGGIVERLAETPE